MNNLLTFLSLTFAIGMTFPSQVFANHGPGTSGGGSSTQSGETLKEGQFVLSLDENYTNYDNVSQEEAEVRAAEAGAFDSLSDAFLTTATLSYGITEDLQIDASIGWYSGRDFREIHEAEDSHSKSSSSQSTAVQSIDEHHEDDHGAEEEGPNVGYGNPEGLTDMMLRAKYRVMKGPYGHLSLIGGVIFPTGKDDEYLSNGEKLEPSSQPGTGRYSVLGGAAYSKYLTSHITLDISSIYVYRFEQDEFQVGDRVDSGMAIAYRFNESVTSFPQFALFGEIAHQYIGKDKESGANNPNSGGNTLFLTPGMRIGFNQDVGMIVAPVFPVAQALNGDQLETDFRITSSLFVRF